MKNATLLLLLTFCQTIFATNTATIKANAPYVNSVQLLRLDYTAPNGAIRELALGFTSDNAASDGLDYGYDASVIEPYTNDLNWLIEDNRYVIQGVGAFDDTKQYLFGLYNEFSGDATIELSSTQNFDTVINVFIYDALLDTYTQINDSPYTVTIDAQDYTDRFYIAFSQPETTDSNDTADSLDISGDNDITIDPSLITPKGQLKISYIKGLNQLKISSQNKAKIEQITVYNYNGSTLESKQNINNKKTSIYVNTTDKNLILHIKTDTETIIKQVMIGSI